MSQTSFERPNIVVADDEAIAARVTGQRIADCLGTGIFHAATSAQDLFDHCLAPEVEDRPELVFLDDRYLVRRADWEASYYGNYAYYQRHQPLVKESPYYNPLVVAEGAAVLSGMGLPISLYKPSAVNFAGLLRLSGYAGYIYVVSAEMPQVAMIDLRHAEIISWAKRNGLKTFDGPLINGWMPKLTYRQGSTCAHWDSEHERMVLKHVHGSIQAVVAQTLRDGGYAFN